MAKKKFNNGIGWIAWSGILVLFVGGGWLTYGLTLNRPSNTNEQR